MSASIGKGRGEKQNEQTKHPTSTGLPCSVEQITAFPTIRGLDTDPKY